MHACVPAIHEYDMHCMIFIIIILLAIDMSNVLLNEWETV